MPGTPPLVNCPNGRLQAGLVGFWQFEEGQGIRTSDSSGNGNTGTVVEGGTSQPRKHPGPRWTDGHTGRGLHLDGVDDWVLVADSGSLDSTGIQNGVSVTAWVRTDRYSSPKDGINTIVSRHELGTRLAHFGLFLYQGLPAASVHFFKAIGVNTVPLGKWAHLAMAYDGITVHVYMNGTEDTFLDVGWPIAADETPLTIGGAIREDDVIDFHTGTVDEVRLYNRELNPCEVLQAMQ
jgi:hypothetical protein